jgi:O-antigen biosynthesis protein
LEPDQRHGYAYLQATRDALASVGARAGSRVILVSHDAERNGAQLLALNLARALTESLGCVLEIVVLGSGPLMADFAQIAPVHTLGSAAQDGDGARALARDLALRGFSDAIVNSSASGGFTAALKAAGIATVVLVHELPDLIRRHNLMSHVSAIAANADRIVFPAQAVRQAFESLAPLDSARVRIRPQGLYKRNRFRDVAMTAQVRSEVRARFSLSVDTQLVIGAGFGDHRKGIDLFVDVALALAKRSSRVAFIWVGGLDASVEQEILRRGEAALRDSRLFFPGHQSDTDPFYAGADVFALTSREDPFPSVLLEALDAGVPVVGFEEAGGFADLSGHGCVRLAPAFDTVSFAQTVEDFLSHDVDRHDAGEAGRALIDARFGFRQYAFDLLAMTRSPPPRVSVVVPNYNYLRYLPERIDSILRQTLPIYELIVLDDASTDGSRDWIERTVKARFDSARVILNETNSGSVFRQWAKGVELARGDYVWIAEADDLAEPEFLEEAIVGFADPATVLSFTQSKQIDADGRILSEHYLDYVEDVSPTQWRSPYSADGKDEIAARLAVKNTIPNVSAVLFRREILQHVLKEHLDDILRFHIAGDWTTYVAVLEHGTIAFSPRSLNLHRRHESGLTIRGHNERLVEEIAEMQRWIRSRHRVDPDAAEAGDRYIAALRRQMASA